jgi:cytochrome c oxidase cbb3-type subunit 1
MTREVRWFIRSALVWLSLGVLVGAGLALTPGRFAHLRPAHLHVNLLGFMSLMIFGVAYHILPRFTATPVRSEILVRVNLYASNLGLAAMVTGWTLRQLLPAAPPLPSTVLIGAGGAVAAAGSLAFVFNVWDMLAKKSDPVGLPGMGGPPCGGAPSQGRLIQLRRGPGQ